MKNLLIVPLLLVLILFTLNGYTEDYMKWGLPENATLRLGKGQIYDLKHSPDGDFIAVATSIGVWIYDADSGKEIRLLRKHRYPVDSLAFSPNGKMLASGGSDGIHLWEPHTGQHLFALTESAANNLVFFSDGHTLAGTSNDTIKDRIIRLWDVGNRTISKTLTGHRRRISSLAVSPDGKTIVSGSSSIGEEPQSNALRWWDVETGKTMFYSTNVDTVTALSFSPDGKILACADSNIPDDDQKIHLFDSVNRKILRTLPGLQLITTTLTFSPDGELLASSGSGSTIHLWNPRSGKFIHTFRGHTESVIPLSFSPDGETLVSGSWDGTIRFWDTSTKQHRFSISGHWGEVEALAFSNDSKTLVSGIPDATIHKWDIETGQLTSTLVGRNDETIMAFDITRDLFASHTFGKQAGDNINIRSIDTGDTRITMNTMNINTENFTFFKDQLTFSHDGTLIYTSDGKKVKYGHPFNFEFTPHDNLEESVYSKDIFKALASSPDNKLLAVATTNKVSLWKFGTNELIRLYTGVYFSLNSFQRNALAFSSDSKTLALGDMLDIRLIEVDTGDLITTLSGNNSDISALAFSPNGKVLASGNEDGTILIWDLEKIMKGQ